MPENLSPEGADEISQGSDELTASKRTNSGGGYSPHSTTGTTTGSRKRAVTNEEEEEEEETEDDDPTLLVPRVSPDSDSVDKAGPAINPTPLKQVLAAAIKLSGSISRQHSERTLQIVTDLLIGSIDSAEFQQRVTQVVHLPFRPIVSPLLDKQLPWLRREMAGRLHPLRLGAGHSSVSQQQTTTHYIKEHVKALLSLDRQPDNPPSSEPTQPLSVWQVFQPGEPTSESSSPNTRKRRASASLVENSSGITSAVTEATAKRPAWYSTSAWTPPKVNSSVQQLQQQSRQLMVESTKSSSSSFSYPSSAMTPFQPQQSPQGDEEWANIHTMLNCILSMVEKTRRALGILQQRANDNQQQQKRRDTSSSSSHHQHQVYEASELRRQAGELIAQTLKATEDRVSQVKRKAEEAVHDVRRAAMAELQRALSAERLRAERLAAEARRQGAEEALSALGQHAMGGAGGHHQANKEVCWNCGRRANETCSGCNVARYCSTFCQHKHWEVHHKICGRVSQLMLAAAAATTPSSASMTDHRTETGGSSPSSSHISVGRNNSKTPSPVQQSTSGPASYVH